MSLFAMIAWAELAFFLGNAIAWRRNVMLTREMQMLNRDLAVALELAAAGRYDEAQKVAEAWKGRMGHFRFDRNVWVSDKNGELVDWPWWRRWLGIKPLSRRTRRIWEDWI